MVSQTLRQAIHYMSHLPLPCAFYVADNHELILKQVSKTR